MKKLELLPAVDVAGGQAVRLVRGEAGSETGYGDPLEAAREWVDQGAEWIHLVDLDRAFGRGENLQVIESVIQGCPDVKIELSGGIRDDQSLQQAVDMGAQRVNIGTAALENPEWTKKIISEFGDLVAIGLDVRGETLAARGWTEDGGNLYDTLELLEAAGCERYVVTDVNKDGTLKGPNLQLLKSVMAKTDKPVVASGGISSLEDISALRELVDLGLEGAILGKALYAGKFTLVEALEVAG